VTDTLVAPAAPRAPEPVTHEVVTLANLRSVSRTRSLGLGVAVLVLAAIELLGFGLGTHPSVESTIKFGYDTSTAAPALSSALARVGVLVAGLAVVALGVLCLVRWHRRGLGILAILLGLLVAAWPVALWLGINDGPDGQLRSLTVPVAGFSYLVGAATLVAGVLLVVRRYDRAAYPIFFVAMALFLLAFLVWIARGSNSLTGSTVIVPLSITEVLWATFIGATPLMYGSLSGVLCERSGVVNIAIEGQFMFGALSAAMVSSIIGPTYPGFITATIVAGVVGGLLGLVLAYMALHFRANQIIVGVVIVAFCTAMVQYLMDQVLDVHLALNQGYGVPPLPIPGLSQIPVIGPSLFDQNYLVYLAIVLVAGANFMLFRTRRGLRWRAVGEHPRAAETVGISVVRTRYAAVVIGGFVAGIGGAVFTIGQGIPMLVGITNGEGFIALAIMIFGRWRPWGALAATLLFGFTLSLSSQLNLYISQLVIPTELIAALPYLVTIAAVAGLVGRVRPPAADGIPYVRE
jgi:general nucleoside transport system permease protein